MNDQPAALFLIRKVLEKAGYGNLATCDNGIAASRHLGQYPVDMLITDVHMPSIDGWRLCRMVRAGIFQCPASTPIIVVSGTFGEQVAEVTARAFEVDRFLSLKEIQQLPQAVHDCLALSATGQRRPTLLVIEDSDATVAVIRHTLAWRFDLEVARDGIAGLEAWLARRHDLILLDLMLPRLSGEEILKQVMTHHPTQAVVVMTAHGTAERFQNMMAEGAADLLSKPFTPEQLRQVCELALRRQDYMLLNLQFAHQKESSPTADQSSTANQPPIRIHTLGRFAVTIDGEPLQSRRGSQPKPLELLKAIIALGRRDAGVAALGEALWPDSEGDAAQVAINTTLHRLRKLLGQPEAVGRRNNRIFLDPAHCWVDAWAFEETSDRIEHLIYHHAAGSRSEAPEPLRTLTNHLMELYQGPFLADELESPWTLACRERLTNRWRRTLSRLGRYREERQEWLEALAVYRRGVESETFGEEFHHRMMKCHQALGEVGESLAIYRRYRKNLATLGVEPSPAMQEFYLSLLAAS